MRRLGFELQGGLRGVPPLLASAGQPAPLRPLARVEGGGDDICRDLTPKPPLVCPQSFPLTVYRKHRRDKEFVSLLKADKGDFEKMKQQNDEARERRFSSSFFF